MSMVMRRTPWLLSLPALLLLGGLLLLPLALTAVLSFKVFDPASGVKDVYTLSHYLHLLSDEYYLGIFWRTLRIVARERCARIPGLVGKERRKRATLPAFLFATNGWKVKAEASQFQTGLAIAARIIFSE